MSTSTGRKSGPSTERLRRIVTGAIDAAVGEATEANAEPPPQRVRNVNVAGRRNVAVSANIDRPGSVRGASTKQRTRVRQDGHGKENIELTETETRRS